MADRAIFEAWKKADEAATASERALKELYAGVQASGGGQPPLESIMEARRLRAEAMDLLNKYIEATRARQSASRAP